MKCTKLRLKIGNTQKISVSTIFTTQPCNLNVFLCVHVGREFNFETAPKDQSTDNGVPYDYWSVMHYGKNAFSNGNGSTIVTKDPKFQDIIGQTYGISPKDNLELNRLYKCSECCCGGSLNSHGVK